MTNSHPDPKDPDASIDGAEWTRLFANIRTLALLKSDRMLRAGGVDDDDDPYDRNARALRLLVGAAQIAARLKKDHEQTGEERDERREAPLTDEEILAIYGGAARAARAARRGAEGADLVSAADGGRTLPKTDDQSAQGADRR